MTAITLLLANQKTEIRQHFVPEKVNFMISSIRL
jgi:hypothetical protein